MRSAAILAGGQATRFGGRDKSALVVDGRTILQRQVAELSRVPGLREILVVGSRGPRGSSNSSGSGGSSGFEQRHPCPGTRAVDDLVPGSGPLGGIHRALTEAQGAPVFVAACDMPFITAPFVEHLFELSRDVDLVVPFTERGYHPLCAVYSRACLGPITRRLGERRLKVIELADEVRTRIVAADELDRFGGRHRLLANVNTPADFAEVEALHDHQL